MGAKLEEVLAEEWAQHCDADDHYVVLPSSFVVAKFHREPEGGCHRAAVAVLGKRALALVMAQQTCIGCSEGMETCREHAKEYASIVAAAKDIG